MNTTKEEVIGWLAAAGILSEAEEKHAGKPWEKQIRELRKLAYRKAVTALHTWAQEANQKGYGSQKRAHHKTAHHHNPHGTN